MTRLNRNRLAGSSARLQAGGSRWFAIVTLSMTLLSSNSSAQSAAPCAGAQAGKVACLFSDVIGAAADYDRAPDEQR